MEQVTIKIKKYNVIDNCDDLIGTKKELIKRFKHECALCLHCDDYCGLLLNAQAIDDLNDYNDNDKLHAEYNPMGAWCFEEC